MLKKILTHSFIRFGLIGVLNGIVGYGTTVLLLNVLHCTYLVSTVIGYVLGLVNSFIWNRLFTFKNRDKIRKTFWKFILVCLVSYGISYFTGLFFASLIVAGLNRARVPDETILKDNIAVLCGMVFYTVTNYLGNRFFTFKEKKKVER